MAVINLRDVPEAVHKAAKVKAAESGVSFKEFCVDAIAGKAGYEQDSNPVPSPKKSAAQKAPTGKRRTRSASRKSSVAGVVGKVRASLGVTSVGKCPKCDGPLVNWGPEQNHCTNCKKNFPK